MIYAVFSSVVLTFLAAAFYPKFKVKNHNISTPLVVGVLCFIVLLVLDLTLPTEALIIDKVAIDFFGVEIHWYALWIMLGVLIALWYGLKEGKKLGISSDDIYLGLLITLPLAIIGARLWYVLFNLDSFHSIGDVFGLNGGWSGLGIQGGVIVAIITVYFFCRYKRIPIYRVFEILAPGFLIGQILGRWGNFCNHELYGPLVHNEALFNALLPRFISENMYISGGNLLPGLKEGYYQPMFLYESLLNLTGLAILLSIKKFYKGYLTGDAIGFYLIWYGVVRTITESFRFEGEVLMWGPIRVSILISVVFMIVGITFLVLKRFLGKQKLYHEIIREIEESRLDLVMFDLDGTILDSKELIYQTFIYVFNNYFPEHELTDQELDSFFGPTLDETFSKYEPNKEKRSEIIKCYREFNEKFHDELVKPMKGAKEVLRDLHSKGYKIAVVSSKVKPMVMKGLKTTGMLKYVDYVLGGDEVTRPKPNPEGLLKVCDHFSTRKAIYIGDTPTDILAGKKAKIRTCAFIEKGSSRTDAMLKEEPDASVNTLLDLYKVLGE